jgi:arylformamidase
VTGSALAQEPPQPPRVKGPSVWLDMDQKELDDAYDQSVWAPNHQHVTKRRAVWSESISARLKPERIAYGRTEIETLDI